MSFEFVELKEGECPLCGEAGALTGEHKIKASLLKRAFGSSPTIIAGKDKPKILQSPKSKNAQFKKGICKECNSSRTQAADKAFVILHENLVEINKAGLPFTDETHRPNFVIPPETEINYFRYFAKLICCYLAEVDGPRSLSLSTFSTGESDTNLIKLSIEKDHKYYKLNELMDHQGIIRHGGLRIIFDSNKKFVKSFSSSLSAEGIHYTFRSDLNKPLGIYFYKNFPKLVRCALQNLEN